jgi:hypothetical protein
VIWVFLSINKGQVHNQIIHGGSMKRIHVSLFVCSACLAFCTVSAAPAKAQQPHIITFDAPGADTTPGNLYGTSPTSINFWGTITGYYQDANGTYHGFVRNPRGTFKTFDAPGADTTAGDFNGTLPSSINDSGAITGSYYDTNGFGHGFIRSPDGKFKSFDVLDVGGGSTPQAINFEGAVVGYYTDSNFAFHAFLRRPNGKFTTWVGPDECTGNGSEGCYGSGATNINAFGTIAAGYNDKNLVHHGLVRTRAGKLITYDVSGAQATGCPGCSSGLNQWGTIAGIYSDANSVNHGYLRSSDGKFTTFDAPGAGTDVDEGTGCPSDCPTSLNDFGAVTGTYIDANFVFHGYLRSPNGIIVTVDPVDSIFTLSSGINDFGVVTGYYVDANFVYHGFVAVPCNSAPFESDQAAKAATSVAPVTTTSALPAMRDPMFRLNPRYRRFGAQPRN